MITSIIPLLGKKKITLIFLLVFGIWFLASQCYAQNFTKKEEKIIISPPENALRIGEKLQYSVEWLGVPIGKIILHVQDIKNIDGVECYHVIARAMPNKFFARFYNVEYTVHTYIDKKTFYARRFEKIRRVNDKVNYVVIDFDREKKEVRHKVSGSAVPQTEVFTGRKRVEPSAPPTFKILDGTQDLFSALYYFRLLDVQENKSYSVTIYYDQRNWPIKMKVGKPFVRDIRNVGSFIVFEASMDTNLGDFILGKRDMFVVFTADLRRIPLEFKFGNGIRSVRGMIQHISE